MTLDDLDAAIKALEGVTGYLPMYGELGSHPVPAYRDLDEALARLREWRASAQEGFVCPHASTHREWFFSLTKFYEYDKPALLILAPKDPPC